MNASNNTEQRIKSTNGAGPGAAMTTSFAAVAMTLYLWVQIGVVLAPSVA